MSITSVLTSKNSSNIENLTVFVNECCSSPNCLRSKKLQKKRRETYLLSKAQQVLQIKRQTGMAHLQSTLFANALRTLTVFKKLIWISIII